MYGRMRYKPEVEHDEDDSEVTELDESIPASPIAVPSESAAATCDELQYQLEEIDSIFDAFNVNVESAAIGETMCDIEDTDRLFVEPNYVPASGHPPAERVAAICDDEWLYRLEDADRLQPNECYGELVLAQPTPPASAPRQLAPAEPVLSDSAPPAPFDVAPLPAPALSQLVTPAMIWVSTEGTSESRPTVCALQPVNPQHDSPERVIFAVPEWEQLCAYERQFKIPSKSKEAAESAAEPTAEPTAEPPQSTNGKKRTNKKEKTTRWTRVRGRFKHHVNKHEKAGAQEPKGSQRRYIKWWPYCRLNCMMEIVGTQQ